MFVALWHLSPIMTFVAFRVCRSIKIKVKNYFDASELDPDLIIRLNKQFSLTGYSLRFSLQIVEPRYGISWILFSKVLDPNNLKWDRTDIYVHVQKKRRCFIAWTMYGYIHCREHHNECSRIKYFIYDIYFIFYEYSCHILWSAWSHLWEEDSYPSFYMLDTIFIIFLRLHSHTGTVSRFFYFFI